MILLNVWTFGGKKNIEGKVIFLALREFLSSIVLSQVDKAAGISHRGNKIIHSNALYAYIDKRTWYIR